MCDGCAKKFLNLITKSKAVHVPRGRKPDLALRARIQALLDQGRSVKEIQFALDLSYQRVYQLKKELKAKAQEGIV